jgi:hypothetical protein
LASVIKATDVTEPLAVQRDRLPFLERDRHLLRLDGTVLAPRRDAHDRLDDRDSRVQLLEIFGLVGGAENVRVGGVGLLDAHLVGQPARCMYSDISLRPPARR